MQQKKTIIFSKLPIRQVTYTLARALLDTISKLPIRQVTIRRLNLLRYRISKLPIRQVTFTHS